MNMLGGLDGEESACNAGDLGSIPGLGRSPRGGHGNPLQYSCLENPPWAEEPGGLQSMGSQESDTPEHTCRITRPQGLCMLLGKTRQDHNRYCARWHGTRISGEL